MFKNAKIGGRPVAPKPYKMLTGDWKLRGLWTTTWNEQLSLCSASPGLYGVARVKYLFDILQF